MVTKFSAVCIMFRKIKKQHEPLPQSMTHMHERWNRQYEVYELSGNDEHTQIGLCQKYSP